MTERFTLLSELGRGGMGVVWKARDEETGQIVALKLMREIYAEDADYVARFERELELAKRINSVHVVRVLGFGVRQKMPYLALEFVDGPSLHDALAKHGPYSWAEASALLAQLAQGLADAHAAGVIHRDVKPSNVLIGPAGVAKITDFGIARGLDSTRLTATSAMIGTPAYLAPEGPKDARSDLYSLGIIGYQLLTGAPPFVGQTYQEVLLAHIRDEPDLTRLPADARPVVAWLLAKDPAQRPRNAWEVIPVVEGRLWLKAQVASASSGEPLKHVAQVRAPQPSRAGATARASLPKSDDQRSAGSWVLASDEIKGMEARAWHTSTVLPHGIVLLAGGGHYGRGLASAQVFETRATAVSRVGPMKDVRLDHAAALVADGMVLVCGGHGTGILASAEVYNSRLEAFRETGPMTTRRQLHTASVLAGGFVLIAGGWDGQNSLATTEIYDPTAGQFSKAPAMTCRRENHTATILEDGNVLLAGGDSEGRPTDSVEFWNIDGEEYPWVGQMATARSRHSATLLADGRTLIMGGRCGGTLSSAEYVDPVARSLHLTSPMRVPRDGHTATLTPEGNVVVVGGSNEGGVIGAVEVFDPSAGVFKDAGFLKTARKDHTADLLPDGRILVAGGLDTNGLALASIELLSLERRQ